jgi:hypothetical protein
MKGSGTATPGDLRWDHVESITSVAASFSLSAPASTTRHPLIEHTPKSDTASFQIPVHLNQVGPNNPFAPLVARLPMYKAFPPEQDRYWVHDKVQDELRHDFRKRSMRERGEDVARAYFDSVPKVVTSETDCGKIIEKHVEKPADLEVDQWKAVYATAFLDRCEKNSW